MERIPGHGGLLCANAAPCPPLPSAADALFDNSTFELPLEIWEKPSGLGLCPLHLVFTICSNIHQWLSLNPDNVVVS